MAALFDVDDTNVVAALIVVLVVAFAIFDVSLDPRRALLAISFIS